MHIFYVLKNSLVDTINITNYKIVQYNKEVYKMTIQNLNVKRKIKSLKETINQFLKCYLFYRNQYMTRYIVI